MIEIDEATGLPKLPEDHFWRIGDSVIYIMRNIPAGEWGEWSGNDYSKLYLKTESEAREAGKPRRLLWGDVEPPRMEYRWRWAAKAVEVYTKYYGEWQMDWIRLQLLEPDPITKSNILERTTEVLEAWNTETALEAEQLEIQGDYPPKKRA